MKYFPKLCICMPAYNEERSIKSSILNIINNNYPNWELHIFLEPSTDNTVKIIKELMSEYGNIKLHLNSIRLGTSGNLYKSLHLSQMTNAKYVSLISANDYFYPDYLYKCINHLENDISTVLCYSYDLRWQPKLLYEDDDIFKRIKNYLTIIGLGNINYGVYRTSLIDSIMPWQYLQGNDSICHFDILLKGKIYAIKEKLFVRNLPKNRSKSAYIDICVNGLKNKFTKTHTGYYNLDLLYGFINCVINTYLPDNYRDKLFNLIINIFYKNRKKIINQELLAYSNDIINQEDEISKFQLLQIYKFLDFYIKNFYN